MEPDELAALTAVLAVLLAPGSVAGREGDARGPRSVAHWSRPERVAMYASPRSWQR
jgi:hypothetical protein